LALAFLAAFRPLCAGSSSFLVLGAWWVLLGSRFSILGSFILAIPFSFLFLHPDGMDRLFRRVSPIFSSHLDVDGNGD